MQEILAWIMLNKLLAGLIMASLFLVLLITLYAFNKAFRNAVNFWWLNFKTDFPAIGTIARVSTNDAAIQSNTIWRDCETNLCYKYLDYYDREIEDPEYYNKCVSYLRKIGEQGRSPTPFFIWIVILGLVVAEALGFAYVLAGYTIPGASESLQQKGAIGIAFVISALLVFLTHSAGGEIYKNSVIGRILQNRGDNDLIKEEVDIQSDHKDDNAPSWQQAYNRFNGGDSKTWILSIVTTIFIIIVAIGATYVRGQVLEKQLIQEVSTASISIYDTAPAELGEIQSNADAKALQEQQEADRKGGWATFIVLAVLFIFIQILGILFGYKWGFAGKNSGDAYEASHRFRTAREYQNYITQKRRAITAKANEKLSKMKRQINTIAKKRANFKVDKDNDTYRTFENFIVEARKNETHTALKTKSIENDGQRTLELSETQKNINHEANIASMKSSIQSQQESAQNTNSDEIETLRKKITRLERKKNALIEEGVKKSDDEILDLEDEIDTLTKKLKGLENA